MFYVTAVFVFIYLHISDGVGLNFFRKQFFNVHLKGCAGDINFWEGWTKIVFFKLNISVTVMNVVTWRIVSDCSSEIA